MATRPNEVFRSQLYTTERSLSLPTIHGQHCYATKLNILDLQWYALWSRRSASNIATRIFRSQLYTIKGSHLVKGPSVTFGIQNDDGHIVCRRTTLDVAVISDRCRRAGRWASRARNPALRTERSSRLAACTWMKVFLTTTSRSERPSSADEHSQDGTALLHATWESQGKFIKDEWPGRMGTL